MRRVERVSSTLDSAAGGVRRRLLCGSAAAGRPLRHRREDHPSRQLQLLQRRDAPVLQPAGGTPDLRRRHLHRCVQQRERKNAALQLQPDHVPGAIGRSAAGPGARVIRAIDLFMLYFVIERFRNRDPVPVYRRFRNRGRLLPDGVRYVSSWVTEDLTTCFQIMDCDDRAGLDRWIDAWIDLVDFEVTPVMTSADARAAVASRL